MYYYDIPIQGFAPVSGVSGGIASGVYQIYPNPVTHELFVSPTSVKAGTYQISLYSLDNREVYKASVQNLIDGHRIELSQVSKGYYYLLIQEPDDVQYVEKIALSK